VGSEEGTVYGFLAEGGFLVDDASEGVVSARLLLESDGTMRCFWSSVK
jgi:hypothetical protein